MIIKFDNNDDNGYAFEDALMKAQYMYPKPDNPFAQDVISHARQIYEGELLERSICSAYPNLFKPINAYNVLKYFPDHSVLNKTSNRVIKKEQKNKTGESSFLTQIVLEWKYTYYDIFHVPTRSIIECKTYTSDGGRSRRSSEIRDPRNRYRFENCDYFIFAKPIEDHSYEITDFLSLTDKNQFKTHNFDEFIQYKY